MNTRPTAMERSHLGLVKEQACSVCDATGPSEAHHIHQAQAFTAVALCPDCHRGGKNGWHGQRQIWKLKKLDELGALNITLKRLLA